MTVRPGRAAGLRRWATSAEGDTLTLPYSDADFLADQIVGYGADVRVDGPPEVRDAVIQRLKEVVAQVERATPAVAPAVAS